MTTVHAPPARSDRNGATGDEFGSGFDEPRVLARVFPERGHFEHTVRFYEHLTGSALDIDLDVREAGLHTVAARFAAPTGRGARIRHAEGLLVEYLEHRPSPDDVDRAGL